MDQVVALEHLLATALRRIAELEAALASLAQENADLRRQLAKNSSNCSIPDDHIDPRRSALFMARSVLRDIQTGGTNACSTS